jgi:hypothetical protein
MSRIRSNCCTLAASGQAAAAPPISVISARRLMPGMGFFPPTPCRRSIIFFDRRAITKKNPASEPTRAGLSPIIRDPYASRLGRLSRGATRRGARLPVRLIRSRVRVCIELLTGRFLPKRASHITRQAEIIAYINDFKLMMIVTLSATPLA